MFNWDEFKNEKVAVWCDTEDKAKEFVEECHERGLKWVTSSEGVTNWSWYASKTCYAYNFSGDNQLTYCDKPFFENRGCKIIKWEGENMKFKVGDKVIRSCGGEWNGGTKYRTIAEVLEEGYLLDDKNSLVWYDGELELYKEIQTEFTFQEVIARIKKGETYIVTDDRYSIKEVYQELDGRIKIVGDDVMWIRDARFELQEPKKRITIYKVEHKQDGKKYDFISSQRLQEEIFVVCDTTKGKSYGRVVGSEDKELTEEEIKQYKECWRA